MNTYSPFEMALGRYALVLAASLFVLLSAWALTGCSLLQNEAPPSLPTSISTPQTGEKGNELSLSATESYEGAPMATDSYWEGGLDGGDEPWWPQDFNTEEYNALKEGGFISAKVRPLSSLSADVDTASYCNVRRMIRDGYFAEDIPAGAIRIEEMLNYFSYDYAQPAGQDLFGTTVQVGDCPWNKDTKLLLMGFSSAPEMRNESAGSNLVFLIDVSGSMDSRDKLDLLQDAFAVLVDQLGDKDRISIVTYASGEDVVLEGASGADKKKIMRAIKRLHADGSTNGEAGLKMAYEIAQDNFIEGGVNRIILASDGDLNVGMTDESSLEDYVSKQRDTGVYLSVLGFGSGNYKDNKMETLADNGNGQYHYIDCVEEAERVFGEKLTANLVPLADDVKLQVEFNPNMVKAYRLIGYENRALADEDFRDDTKDAGEIGPGHQFTVAYEVALVGSAQEVAQIDLKYSGQEQAVEGADERDIVADGEWLTCTMRYRPAGESNAREQSFVVDGSEWTDAPSDDWRFAAAVAWAGMILRDSDYSKDTTLDDVLAFIPKSSGDPYRTEFTELLEELV